MYGINIVKNLVFDLFYFLNNYKYTNHKFSIRIRLINMILSI